MGRAKLEMKYREEARTRITTYMTRMKGMEKKAEELSVLCGVDVLFASFNPDLNALHYWPKNPSDFHRILGRYKSISRGVPSPPSNSLFREEMVSMDQKLEEVRQRISFLEAEKVAASSSRQSGEEQSYGCVVAANEDEDIYSSLEDLDLGINLFLEDGL